MSGKPNRTRPLRRLSKILFAVLGGIAILLAVALGLFRLLVAQIPEYQTELKEWVAEELGLVVDFAEIDARLGLSGPELTLRGAGIGGGREFLHADEARITLDPLTLLIARRIEISRLTLAGVRLTVERDTEGTVRVGDFAFGPGAGGLIASMPQSVEVAIRDSELLYVDAVRERSWRFGDLDIVIGSADGDYAGRASLRPTAGLADRIELGFEARRGAAAADGMRLVLSIDAEAVDLAELASFVPIDPVWPVTGRGMADAEIEWTGSRLEGLRLDLDGEDVRIGAEASEPYERVSLDASWRRTADGWRLELDDVSVSRGGRPWEPSGSAVFSIETDEIGMRAASLVAGFVRLEDLEPIVGVFPETQLAEQWALFEPEGEIRDLDFSIRRGNSSFDYELDASIDGIAVRQVGSTPGIDGVSGRVQASEDSGTIEFRTDSFTLDWPMLFGGSVEGDSLTGAVVWRQGRNIVQILSVDLGIGILGREARASFDLKLPSDGGSPTLDLEAELEAVPLVEAKRYLPGEVMPAPVIDWLDRAVVGGSARNVELSFFGPVRSFPFDAGGGQFRVAADVEGVTLDYMRDWPRGEAIDGQIEFLNAGFFASASGEALGNRTENLTLAIRDMRSPTLELEFLSDATLENVVAYLRSVSLIAERLGPGLARIEPRGGSGSLSAKFDMPLGNLSAFELEAALAIEDGTLAVRGLKPEVSEINGVLTASRDRVVASGIDGVFLGGPITATLATSAQTGYRAELAVDGETSFGALTEAFGLPPMDLVEGQALWRGRLMLPALDPLATTPTLISVQSNLAGIALRLPEPLAKAPGEPTNLALEFRFQSGDRLEVTGNLGATRRFALGFDVDEDALEFTRGAVVFGGDEPRLPVQTGLLVGGRIETVELDPWLALARETGIGRAAPLFLGADVDIAGLYAFGQQLGATSLRVERGDEDWQIDIDSQAIAGEIVIPREASLGPVLANMSRLYLAPGGESGLGGLDPQSLPGIRFEAAEFGFGNRELGRVSATVERVSRGLALTEFQSATENFQIEITGDWLRQGRGTRTSVDAELRSTDVAAALAELGLDPVIEGEAASVTASVWWDEAPSAVWLDHLNGDVSLLVDTGTLREVNPGAGRVVGLMSIAALPRRLMLDFRDVFEEGFAFDEISGSFRIIDGNAYTNDLKFTGPAAEIGVVGRTGLRDRDYRQQLVVAPEPGNMLPTVGGLLGGAGVGAALLIFTRLFKEPLKGIGRASYCLSGSWEDPTVEPIEDDEPAAAERCAELTDEMRPATVND
jgi:uncharacterized protein (TIGR02099 family)